MDAETRSVYAQRAGEYETLPLSDIQNQSLDAFLARLPGGSAILDIGCGPGIHASVMQAAGHEVTAIDATPEFVASAQAKGLNARLGSFEDVQEVGVYDGVWASFSLLHVPKADHTRLIGTLVRALKPGGHIYVGMKIGTGEARDRLGRFYSYVTEDELRDHLQGTGATVVDTTTGADKGLDGSVAPFVLMTARA